MALHGKTEKTAKQKRNRATKPSRAKRLARRWDARVKVMEDYFHVRNAAHARALRIVEYLARRASRRQSKAA